MKLRTLAAFVSPRFGREASACESCGGEFTCGATLAGCWCSEIKLSDETRAVLRERFKSCLCRECLERFAARERGAGEG
ncbi:MAG TPA: cysteine-rich CWC family protein [Pyrinomonadaceae bacterium]|nr:cysteine-rich CWC family protein [Pyrinomonadaceae bacterium]